MNDPSSINVQVEELSETIAHLYILTSRDAANILGSLELLQTPLPAVSLARTLEFQTFLPKLRSSMPPAILRRLMLVVCPFIESQPQLTFSKVSLMR